MKLSHAESDARCGRAYERWLKYEFNDLKEAAEAETIGPPRLSTWIKRTKPPPREPLQVSADGSILQHLENTAGVSIAYKYFPPPPLGETLLKRASRYSRNYRAKSKAQRLLRADEEHACRLRKQTLGEYEEEASEYDSEAETHVPDDSTLPHPDSPHPDSPRADSPPHPDSPHADSPHPDSPRADSPRADSPHPDSPRADSPHPDSPRADSPHADPTHAKSTWSPGGMHGAILLAATRVRESFMRTRSINRAMDTQSTSIPHENAGLDARTAEWIGRYKPQCICSSCKARADFGILLGTAQQLESGKAAMYGSSAFVGHPASIAVLEADARLDTGSMDAPRAKPPRVIHIDVCNRCVMAHSLTGSSIRSEAAALSIWRDELDLDLVASRIRAGALEVPYVELAPQLQIQLAQGVGQRCGKHTVVLALNKADLLAGGAALRRLWGRDLTRELLSKYEPVVIDEALTLRLAAAAPNGMGAAWAQGEVNEGRVMVEVVEMEDDVISAARVTSSEAKLRDLLRQSAVSHILVPNGHAMDEQTTTFANRFEASLFGDQISPETLHRSFFVRAGKAAGSLDASNVVERLGSHYDVQEAAEGEWASHVDFLTATNTEGGVRGVAMRYIAGDGSRARKQRSAGGVSTSLRRDGAGQPRLVKLYPPIRGVEIDDDALFRIAEQSVANPGGDADKYLEKVRMPQMAAVADALLTMRHTGFGLMRLGAEQAGNPLVKASSTIARVYGMSQSVDWAHAYMAVNATAAVNCQGLAIHVDGASRRKEPTAELLSTRWANVLSAQSHTQCKAVLAEARQKQQLLSMLVCLRRGLAIDVAPCSDLLISAGTEDEHGVPQPDTDLHGIDEADLERGYTRSYATSLRPDAEGVHDLPFLDGCGVRRTGLRDAAHRQPQAAVEAVLPGQAPQPRQAPGANRPQRARQPPAQFVAGGNNNIVGAGAGQLPHQAVNPQPAGGWGRARVNRRTGNLY